MLKEQGSTVVLAKIDADANRDVAAAYDVQGYRKPRVRAAM